MGSVDVALERLQVVALREVLDDTTLLGGDQSPFELRQVWRHVLGRAHVRPDNATPLARGIRVEADLTLEVRVARLAGQVDAVTIHVELPAVIDAAEASLF